MNNFHAKIEKRAYEIYLKRGSKPGNQIDDWIQAEKEIKQKPKNSVAKGTKKKN